MRKIMGVWAVCLLLLVALATPVLALEQTYKQWPDQKGVQANKVWSIKFNTPVLASTVTNQNIYVVDSSGKNHKVTLKLAENDKNIQVTPVENYELGASYTLYILKGVASAAPNGIALKSNIKMQFTVASSVAVSFETMIISGDATSVSVPVKVSGLSQSNGMEGLYLEASFDSDKLSYSGVESGSSATGFQYFASAKAGTIAVTGFNASSVQKDGEIVKLNFTIKDRTNPIFFSIKKCEINDIPVTINNGSLSFAESNPSVKVKVSFANVDVDNEQTEFVVPLMVTGLGGDNKLEGVSLKLSYNENAVSFSEIENGTLAPGFQFFSKASGGVISIEGFGASAIASDGNFLNLKFSVLNPEIPANIEFTQVQINDQDVPFENGKIT